MKIFLKYVHNQVDCSETGQGTEGKDKEKGDWQVSGGLGLGVWGTPWRWVYTKVAMRVERWRTEGKNVEEESQGSGLQMFPLWKERRLEPLTCCASLTLSLTFLICEMETMTPVQGGFWRSKDKGSADAQHRS